MQGLPLIEDQMFDVYSKLIESFSNNFTSGKFYCKRELARKVPFIIKLQETIENTSNKSVTSADRVNDCSPKGPKRREHQAFIICNIQSSGTFFSPCTKKI